MSEQRQVTRSTQSGIRSFAGQVVRGARIILGPGRRVIQLDRGKLYDADGKPMVLDDCAGPAYLVAHEAQVAVIETAGVVSDAVSGQVWLDGRQRITGFVDLATQTAVVEVDSAPTSDGMIIESFEFSVRYQVGVGRPPAAGMPPDREPRRMSGQFEYKPRLVRVNHWKDTPESYKEGIKNVSRSIARAIISSYSLRSLTILPSNRRDQLEERFRVAIQNRMNQAADWLNVKSVAIGKVTLPQPMYQVLQGPGVAGMEATTNRVRAEADGATTIIRSKAQAEAFRAIEKAKDGTRTAIINQLDALMQKYPADANRFFDAVQGLIGYMSQDSTQAMRALEALETIAKSSNHVSLYLALSDLLRQYEATRGSAQPGSPAGQTLPRGPATTVP